LFLNAAFVAIGYEYLMALYLRITIVIQGVYMGQQQLLLIVLGIILVAIAVVVGMKYFNTHSIEANKDALVLDCINLATLAQQYYQKPPSMGGGGRSFAGWEIPTPLQSNEDESFQAVVNSNDVIITGTCIEQELNGGDITVQVTATSNSYSVSISSGGSGNDGGGGHNGDDDDDGGGHNGDDDDDDDDDNH